MRKEAIEKLAYDFDVMCLQETRTRPGKVIEMKDFTVLHRHEGRGLAMIFPNKLPQTSVSVLDLEKWCNDDRELQGIRLQKPDERHKSIILINAYMHKDSLTSKEKWEFLDELEDKLGNTIILCGDLNARSSSWDAEGTNRQGLALEDWLEEVVLKPLTTPTPTRLATRPGDSDSTIDIALISPSLTPWMAAETLASHGSDHMPVVFSLIKPPKQNKTSKTKCPFQYPRSQTDVISRLRVQKKNDQQGSYEQQTTPMVEQGNRASMDRKTCCCESVAKGPKETKC